MTEYDAGAGCARLFELRARFRVPFNESAEEHDANEKLSLVGCSSASSTRRMATESDGPFTVNEYRIYYAVINAPMSISEAEAYKRAASRFSVTPTAAKEITSRVQWELNQNGWLGRPEAEIRHASDWSGERP